jgi:hypothetical protein
MLRKPKHSKNEVVAPKQEEEEEEEEELRVYNFSNRMKTCT